MKTDEDFLDPIFELLDDQIIEDLIQIVFRTSYLKYGRKMKPRQYALAMRVVLYDTFGGSEEMTDVELGLTLHLVPETIAKARKSELYPQLCEEVIGVYQDLQEPKGWMETLDQKVIQDRAVKRQLRIGLSSGNENAVIKALESMAERVAPVIHNAQQQVVHITIGQDEIDAERETRQITASAKLIEGEVIQ